MSGTHLTEWDSKAALRADLDAGVERAILIGEAAESPRRFFSCVVASNIGTIKIGVISSSLGGAPGVAALDEGLFQPVYSSLTSIGE